MASNTFFDQPKLRPGPPALDRLTRASIKEKKNIIDLIDFPANSKGWAGAVSASRLLNLGLKVYSTNNPNYVEWVLDVGGLAGRTNTPRTVKEWFQEVAGKDFTLQQALDEEVRRQSKNKGFARDIRPRNRVFVPRSIGLRYGELMSQLIQRRTIRSKALFIAFFGVRNPVSCCNCVMRAGNQGCEQEPEPVKKDKGKGKPDRTYKPESYPFDECVSFRDRWSDSCANCMWAVLSVSCDYQMAVQESGGGVSLAARGRRDSGAGWGVMFNPSTKCTFRKTPRRLAHLERQDLRPSGDPPAIDY